MDEPTETAAVRELEEETGYIAGKVQFLLSIYTTVAFCNEKIDIYLARDLKRRESQHLDEDEFIDVELEELVQMIYDGKIEDSKTVSAIMTYKSFLADGRL